MTNGATISSLPHDRPAPAALPMAGDCVLADLPAPRRMPRLPEIELRGIRLHAVTERQAIGHILAELDARRGGWVITPNLDHLRRLVQDRNLRDLYGTADLLVADGMTLVWASRIQGTPLPERVTGSNLISSLTAAAGRHGRSIYLMGGDPGTAENAAEVLCRKYPGVCIAGTDCPPFGFEHEPRQLRQCVRKLCDAQPDIIYVGLGSPKQEWFIGQLRGHLPRAWWLGVGISFSFVCGRLRRAPVWMQRTGLEWLHRLAQEPRRLARRYLVQGLPFGTALLVGAAMQRLRRQH